MHDHPVKDRPYLQVKNSVKHFSKKEQITRQQTEKYLLYTLCAAIFVLLLILIHMVSEYVNLQTSSPADLQQQYVFGGSQPFYKQSAAMYQNFVLRFIIINGLISFFGIISIVLQRPWLYLLIIVMALISVLYFLIL